MSAGQVTRLGTCEHKQNPNKKVNFFTPMWNWENQQYVERGRRKRVQEKQRTNERQKRKTWRERTDSGQSIFTTFSMFWPAQMMRRLPLIGMGLNPHLCLCEWAVQLLCVISRGLGQTRGRSFLPKILYYINILLKMSLNVIACYFYNITGNYMILYVIIMWLNALKSAAGMTFPDKSILNTRSHFVDVGVNLCGQ